MVRINSEKELQKSVKDGLLPLYLIFGQEEQLRSSCTALLCRRTVNGVLEEFNLHRYSGKKLDLQLLADTVEAPPVLAEKRCVVVDEFDMAGVSDAAAFFALLSDLPDYTVLLLKTEEPNFDVKPKAANKKLLDLLQTLPCALVKLDTPQQGDLLRLLRERFAAAGRTVSDDVLRYLAASCPNDLGHLYREADKLIAYGKERELTKEAVDALVTADVQARIFDLAGLILHGSYTAAMQNLSDLFYRRESAVGILSVLSAAFCDLYKASVMREQGISVGQAAEELDYKRLRFRLENALREVPRLPKGYCVRALELLADADRRLKSSSVDERVILEETVTRLFALRQKR